MRTDNIQMLNDTLALCKQGYYFVGGRKVPLKLSPDEMRTVRVFLPEELEALKSYNGHKHAVSLGGRCGYGCENMDSFTLARKRYRDCRYMFYENDKRTGKEILVLNLANPVNPGGGVCRGARAQEEDLCRKSSLLLSLESEGARAYYSYNRRLNTYMGSDAVIITPKVEILKDENGNLLPKTEIVAVMTCAAPMIRRGMEGLTDEQYRGLVYNRICGMLRCAAYLGYEALVLGAFGCGAFGNDAHVVSDLFYKALKELRFDGVNEASLFRRIDFAVLSHDERQYNFREFYRNFGGNHFYAAENEAERKKAQERIKAREKYLDKIAGSLLGGAAGDALGYPVEFLRLGEIQEEFDKRGITKYALDPVSGKALISDDTQMTLFTANGILFGETRCRLRGIGAAPRAYVQMAYQDWLTTQIEAFQVGRDKPRYSQNGGVSWLLDVPELYSRRAPGLTCLSALGNNKEGNQTRAENNSKGCGGVMRVAPLGLHYHLGENYYGEIESLDKEGAAIAAITHGHSLGYMPAAVLTHILNRIVYPEKEQTLKEIICQARDTVAELFQEDDNLPALCDIINRAMALAENHRRDAENIAAIGEGWVAEETLAIAIYCSLRHEHDFSAGIIAAVNHDGDSDSTGAVTGNILGAINGYSAIEDKWKQKLELRDVILEMAADLCHGCQMSEYSQYYDENWMRKYGKIRWKSEAPKPVFFWRDNEENGCFSNWYDSPFVVDDFRYRHMEQYLMAQKAKLFHDAENYTAILRADTPAECKKLGRLVKPFDLGKWESARNDILKRGLFAKFSQNEELKAALLATGNAILAEASPKDFIYGIGLSALDAAKVPPDNWPGRNLLGRALMEVRTMLSCGMSAAEFIQTPGFYELNKVLRNGLTL